MRFLLDSDILDHYHRGRASVLRRTTAAGANNLAISIITWIEVLRARFDAVLKAANSRELKTAQHWLDDSERLLQSWRVIRIDHDSAETFERLRFLRGLRKIGRADLPIASIAIAHEAILVTRNTRDFSLVPGLHIENWVD